MNKILIILSPLLCFISCTHRGHLETNAVSLLIDNTDANRIFPDANSVVKLYGYNTKKLCAGASFHLGFINDFLNNKEIDIDIPNQAIGEKENVTDDVHFRKQTVIAFRDEVFQAIQAQTANSFSERPASHVYERICEELVRLDKIEASKKILIVSSDLAENTDYIQSYQASFQRSIEDDFDKAKEDIIEEFEDIGELPDNLKDISIYILYTPQTKEDDIRFSFFKAVYREMLEERGAKVHIKSVNEIKEYNYE